jgi:SAM-dependent methyltransferase
MRFRRLLAGATTDPWEKQSGGQSKYPAVELLIRGESDLARYNERVVDLFIRHAGELDRDGVRVLDFGAGLGVLSRIFQEKTGLKPDGVELDDHLRTIFCARGFNGYASLLALENSYDIIFSSNVLEHIEDDALVLQELNGKLKNGGVLLLYVPAFPLIWSRMDDRVGHYRRYTRRTLTQKLKAAGYNVTSAYYCDSVGFIVSILFKLFGSRSGEPSSRSLKMYDKYLFPVSMICDILVHDLFGKNVFVAASKGD